jgi:putative transposase
MLTDSFPVQRRAEWASILGEPDSSAKRRKLENWLDCGHGACWLRGGDIAELVQEVLLQDDGNNFQLQVWVIMPNHVHVVVDVWDVPLAKLVGCWKGKSSRLANVLLGKTGPFWEADYFDTVVRDADHLARAIRYTEENPTKAHLIASPRDWRWGSAGLRDEYHRLPGQGTSKLDRGV